MAHNTSGLPPLDIEPFDPSALYAAAGSPERQDGAAPTRRRSLRVLALVLTLVAVIAVVTITLAVR